MSKKQMTLIYYYVPEDHDDEDTPNVFGVMVSKNNIRLQHLYDNFPLKGSYIFRFKVMYDNIAAWLDLPELDTKLPTYKDKIVVKATRISWETNAANPYGHYRFVKRDNTTVQQQQVKKQGQQPTPVQKKVEKSPTPAQPTKMQTTDLLSSHNEASSTLPHDFDLLNAAHNPKTTSQQNTVNTGMGDLLL